MFWVVYSIHCEPAVLCSAVDEANLLLGPSPGPKNNLSPPVSHSAPSPPSNTDHIYSKTLNPPLMAHLFPSSLFVYEAREVFISNASLVKLKISEMGFIASSKKCT